jgi:hypothetical protein
MILNNIIRLNKRSEYEEGMFSGDLGNRALLFHGTKTSSLLSIMA